VWRLLKPALPAATFREVNMRLRDAGRPLGAARDAKVLVVALDRAWRAGDGVASASVLKALRRGLVQHGKAVKRAVMLEPTGIALSREALRGAYRRVLDSSISKRGWSPLGKGLRRTYARGRRMYYRARSARRAQDLHEWRKRAKDLQQQLIVLKPLAPGPISKRASKAGNLAERLGDDHDLAVLRAQVLSRRGADFAPEQCAGVVVLIDRLRADLQSRALVLGARVYKEKPAEFAERFGKYWHAWRRMNKAKRTAGPAARRPRMRTF